MKRKLSIGVGCIIIVLVMALWYVKPSKIDIITEQIISFKSESMEEPMITLELYHEYDNIYKFLVNSSTERGTIELNIQLDSGGNIERINATTPALNSESRKIQLSLVRAVLSIKELNISSQNRDIMVNNVLHIGLGESFSYNLGDYEFFYTYPVSKVSMTEFIINLN